jgi:quercetin dioxygenase-like cupin family protein
MKVIRSTDGETKPGKTFTGPARLQSQLLPQTEGGIKITMVWFEDGARTHWHDHPGEQVLYVLEGKGRVGDGVDEWVIEPGDIVYTGPGEKHWHGAFPGHSMTHISITNVGAPQWYDAPEEK